MKYPEVTLEEMRDFCRDQLSFNEYHHSNLKQTNLMLNGMLEVFNKLLKEGYDIARE